MGHMNKPYFPFLILGIYCCINNTFPILVKIKSRMVFAYIGSLILSTIKQSAGQKFIRSPSFSKIGFLTEFRTLQVFCDTDSEFNNIMLCNAEYYVYSVIAF